jgi:hypothetical protein
LQELRGYLAVGEGTAVPDSDAATIDHFIRNPHSIRYFNHAWGVNRKYHNDYEDELFAPPTPPTPAREAFTSCSIENRQAAKMRFTAKKLYIADRVDALMASHAVKDRNQNNVFILKWTRMTATIILMRKEMTVRGLVVLPKRMAETANEPGNYKQHKNGSESTHGTGAMLFQLHGLKQTGTQRIKLFDYL